MAKSAHSKELARAVGLAVKKWARRFERPAWPVFLREEVGPLQPSSNRYPQAIAEIKVAETANEVYVWYLHTLASEAVDRVMCHEMGHWVMADLWEFLRSTLNKRDYAEARRLIEHIVETYTIALTEPDRRHPFQSEQETD